MSAWGLANDYTYRYFKIPVGTLLVQRRPGFLLSRDTFTPGDTMTRTLSIRMKFVVLSLASMLGAVLVVSFVSLWQAGVGMNAILLESTSMLDKAVGVNLLSKGQERASQIQGVFTKGIDYSRAVADFGASAMHMVSQHELDAASVRSGFNQVLSAGLARDERLLGVWAIFEPGAFGNDSSFKGAMEMGGNETGRFSSYWNRVDGKTKDSAVSEKLLSATTLTPSGEPANYYYTCPQQTLRPCVSEPFSGELSGKSLLMTTISAPIVIDGRFVGAVGVDIPLDSLQALAEATRQATYDGLGTMKILSSRSVVAADTASPATVGQLSNDPLQRESTSTVTLSERLSRANGRIAAVIPINVGTDKPWRIQFSVPSEVIDRDATTLEKISNANRDNTVQKISVIAILAACFASILMWVTASQVTRPLTHVANRLRDIASGEGDLTRRIEYLRNDELGEVTLWFNRFLDKLQPIIRQVQGSLAETRTTATESLAIAGETSTGMQAQFKEIDQLATASNEMSATAQEVARSATGAAEAAKNANDAAHDGLKAIKVSRGEITVLADQVSRSMDDVMALSINSAEIEKVLDVIRGVAQQTNLLALNAAIEAARAGESGRGFAVVADEVRTLASRTQDSVEQIRGVIETLQTVTLTVVDSMRDSQKRAVRNAAEFEITVDAFSKIGAAVSMITEKNLQIAAAAEEQSSVAEEVNRNISNIRSVTDSLSVRAETGAGICRRLDVLALEQQRLAAQFKA